MAARPSREPDHAMRNRCCAARVAARLCIRPSPTRPTDRRERHRASRWRPRTPRREGFALVQSQPPGGAASSPSRSKCHRASRCRAEERHRRRAPEGAAPQGAASDVMRQGYLCRAGDRTAPRHMALPISPGRPRAISTAPKGHRCSTLRASPLHRSRKAGTAPRRD